MGRARRALVVVHDAGVAVRDAGLVVKLNHGEQIRIITELSQEFAGQRGVGFGTA